MKVKISKYIVIIILLIILLLILFRTIMINKKKIGHNNTSQEIVENILSINEYETEIVVEINSNKNKNKYKIKQIYRGEDDNSQEVLEPTNIAGVKTSRKNGQIVVENSKLTLKQIYENYNEFYSNSIDLYSFINDYKSISNSKWEEKDGIIIMIVQGEILEKKLYIDKASNKPKKMEIKDNNKKINTYIEYITIDYK